RNSASFTGSGRPITSPVRSRCSRKRRWNFLPKQSAMMTALHSVCPTAPSAPPTCRWVNSPLGGNTLNARGSDPERHSQSKYLYGQDIGATALSYLCWALWHLGYVDQATAVANEATKRAEALLHPFTLAYTICHARGMMDIFRRCAKDTRSYAN